MATKEDLFALYKKTFVDIKDTSINAYISAITKISKDLGEPLEPNTFVNFTKIKKFIESSDISTNTMKNKANSILMYLKANGINNMSDTYGQWISDLRDKIDNSLGQNEKSEKEKGNWMSKEELEKFIDNMVIPELDKTNKTYEYLLPFQNYFMVAFHLQYPLRNDLAETSIGINPYRKKIGNYIRIRPYLKTAGMFLANYKTESTYGTITFEIEGRALSALLLYYQALKNFAGTNRTIPLIIGKDGEPLTSNNYTKHFNAIFKDTGKSVSTTLIRKAVVSSVYDTKKIKELSRIMGHSPEMALNIYAKDL